DELLRLDGGNTDLSQPVVDLLNSYDSVLVITDKEGVATIQGVDVMSHTAQPAAPPGIEVRVCRNR
ncbi:MAG: hypothetical protein HY348_13595, partial [Nitrospira defluvii]|nr:hypothetical protein [Nitrospira defluvii]